MTDQVTAWALAAARGDRGAAEAFVRATQGEVGRFLTHLAGPNLAEDLAQETFLRAFRSLPGFAGRSSARTWLFAIARRVAVDHVRMATARPRLAAAAIDWETDLDVARSVTGPRFDEHLALLALLDVLTREQREAFVATQVVSLSYEEAADVCGCPIGTIRSRVARARSDLIAAMGEQRPARRMRPVREGA